MFNREKTSSMDKSINENYINIKDNHFKHNMNNKPRRMKESKQHKLNYCVQTEGQIKQSRGKQYPVSVTQTLTPAERRASKQLTTNNDDTRRDDTPEKADSTE